MRMNEHLRATRRAALAFGIGFGIAASALGAHIASRALHVSAGLTPPCVASQAMIPETGRATARACAAAAARLG